MHLVFVTSLVPDGQPSTGYEIANAAILGALRRAGVRVTVLGYVWPGSRPADPDNTIILGEVAVSTGTASVRQKIEWLGRAVLGGNTFSSAKLTVAGESGLRDALRSVGPFEGYVLNAVQMAGAFPHLFADKPSLFVAHNVEHVSARQNAAAARSTLERVMYRREAALLQRLERRFCDRAAFVFTLAEEDQAPLGVARPERSAVLPLVTGETPPVAAAAAPDCDAALVGTWDWAPNRIGLDWFLQEVVPQLPPDLTVRIAGSIAAVPVVDHPGVTFVGRVEDAARFIVSARAVPLIARAGTGVQLKTIETFELGLPCVATAASLRGIAHMPANCMLADAPGDFAAALVKTARAGARVDGRAFHAAQMAAMDAAMAEGLARLEASIGIGSAA